MPAVEAAGDSLAEAFARDGCCVVPQFASAEEVADMKRAALAIVREWDGRASTVFRTDSAQESAQGKDDYFMSSGPEVRCFWEQGAAEEAFDRSDPVEVMRRVNKIGHGLHVKNPVFRAYAHSAKVRETVARLGWRAPVLPQSMYILKNARLGGEVTAHQDSTFLLTEPRPTCLGLWLALDAATLDNGCLWFRPGSHSEPVRRHFRRQREAAAGAERMAFAPLVDAEAMTPLEGLSLTAEGAEAEAEADAGSGSDAEGAAARRMAAAQERLRALGFVSVECSAGDLVVIHGQVEHLSLPNLSQRQRHTFQLHLVEGPAEGVTWHPLNWLQYPSGAPFPAL